MPKFSRLRAIGPLGSQLANILVFLTTNWVLVMSTGSGIIVAIWANATAFVQQPAVRSGIVAFLAILWTFIGILVLNDRRRPQQTSPAPDYRYGLTFEGIMVLFFPNHDDALGFGLNFRNFSPSPVHYHVETCEIRIMSRVAPKIKGGELSSYLARGAGRTSFLTPFKKYDVTEFYGKTTDGTMDFVVTYGAPDEPPVRRLTMSWKLTLQFPTADDIAQFTNPGPAPMGFVAVIVSEKDEFISNA